MNAIAAKEALLTTTPVLIALLSAAFLLGA